MTGRFRAVAWLGLAGIAACDTTVTNPGPVRDEFLAERSAAAALVNGSGRALASGINWVGYTGAAITREVHPAGSTGSFGISNRWQNGLLDVDDGDLDTHWEQTQRARWLSEESIRRLVAAGPPPAGTVGQTVAQFNTLLQQAYIYAGYANRVLGENMCDAVIDGGPAAPVSEFALRAEDHFTKALAISATGTLATAALAGRAQARVTLGKWTEALADAALVPNTFTYNINYFNLGEDAQRNRIFFAVAGIPYRAHTQWSTWIEEYSKASRDPRVPYTITTQQGDAAIECCGRVPFLPQAKYTTSASPIKLANGREMRLIEAEARLRANDFTGALTLISQVRTLAGAPAVTAASSTEAWTLLKRERGIELWLEARRMGDLKRWKAANTPGALHELEMVNAKSHLTRQDLCFPISRSERATNPNFKT